VQVVEVVKPFMLTEVMYHQVVELALALEALLTVVVVDIRVVLVDLALYILDTVRNTQI
jgi:hypothetical protein